MEKSVEIKMKFLIMAGIALFFIRFLGRAFVSMHKRMLLKRTEKCT